MNKANSEDNTQMIEGKTCPNCYTFKPLSYFGKRTSKGRDIKQPYCIECKRLLDRQYKKAIREKR